MSVAFTPFEFTQFAINHKGKPINLKNRPWLPAIYNGCAKDKGRKKTLLIFGRQCEKSTSIGNLFISLANLIPYLKILYVTASNPQMREFSDERLRAVIADSPKLLQLSGQVASSLGTRQVQNVQTKRWINGSKITLRSVYRSADRVRGIPTDLLGVDELQDVYTDSLPVIEETLFASELEGGPISIYSGTPKSFQNNLELYWARYSTKNEWATQCSHCNFWNVIEVENVGKHGLICSRCTKDIDPIHGRSGWVRYGSKEADWEGFRFPQPIILYAFRDKPDVFSRKWADLLRKVQRYPRAKLQNEVLARSYDSGFKPVSYDEVRNCCIGSLQWVTTSKITKEIQATHTWGGIDWGTGLVSYTIISIWGYNHRGIFTLFFAKRYEGIEADSDFFIVEMIRLIRLFNVRRVGTDWGFGFDTNPKLFKALGVARVATYQLVGKQSEKVSWDKLAQCFQAHRSRVMNDAFELIRRGPKPGGIQMPGWEAKTEFDQSTESFCENILAIYQEFSQMRGEIIYNHPPDQPDDFFHTLVLAFLASQLDHPRPDIQAPGVVKP